jgi:hypothetical protein
MKRWAKIIILCGLSVILFSIIKGGRDRAYASGFADGVSAAVVYFKAQKKRPEIHIDTVFVDTISYGRFHI